MSNYSGTVSCRLHAFFVEAFTSLPVHTFTAIGFYGFIFFEIAMSIVLLYSNIIIMDNIARRGNINLSEETLINS